MKPNFWIFLKTLQKEEKLAKANYLQYRLGYRSPPQRKKKWRYLNDRIFNLKNRFESRNLNIDDYWTNISHVCQNIELENKFEYFRKLTTIFFTYIFSMFSETLFNFMFPGLMSFGNPPSPRYGILINYSVKSRHESRLLIGPKFTRNHGVNQAL